MTRNPCRWYRWPLFFLLIVAFLAGCDPVTRHRALTVFFNKVPSFPEPEEMCRDHQKSKEAALLAASRESVGSQKQTAHLPYEEKRCNDCHSEQKDLGGGLVLPRNKLCFKCHPDILQHGFAHGPAAEGDCLACHLPHTSSYSALLMEDRAKLCAGCHVEPRIAAEMHERLGRMGMVCIDCHDPHSGADRYFLK